MSELTTQDKVRRMLIALVVIACIVGVGFAVAATTEVDENGDPIVEGADPCEVDVSGDVQDIPGCDPQEPVSAEIVEQLFPPRNSEALQQVQMGIDLGPGYTGVLVVDDREVPADQVDERPELNQLFFSPGEGRVIEEWRPGRNCVRAIVWPVSEGRDGDSTRDVDWCFEVT